MFSDLISNFPEYLSFPTFMEIFRISNERHNFYTRALKIIDRVLRPTKHLLTIALGAYVLNDY